MNEFIEKPVRIVVVDDSQDISTVIRMRLEANGFQVYAGFSTGEEAINAVADLLPDLVVMDVQLKGRMSGIEAGIEIQKIKNIPIIYITAFDNNSEFQAIKASQPHLCLCKPYEAQDLLNCISNAFDRKYILEPRPKPKKDGLELEIEERTAELQMAYALMKKKADKLKESKVKAERHLREREFLLQEIEERVKDNMQLIMSLIGLQIAKDKNEKVRMRLNETLSRIQVVAIATDIMYQSRDVTRISLDQYLKSLIKAFSSTYSSLASRIGVKLSVDEVRMSPDNLVSVGLILNEIISNSVFHAFPDEMTGEIGIFIKKKENNFLEMIVTDNGVGLSNPSVLDSSDTLGINLIRTFVSSNLKGNMFMDTEWGVSYNIRFQYQTNEDPRRKSASDDASNSKS